MKIIFRTDASIHIGTGHVMRCLTLADALKVAGAKCHFICRQHPGNLITQIRQRGFTVSVLQTTTEAFVTDDPTVAAQSNYATWLGTDWATDAAQTKDSFGKATFDLLIVDHYALDARWEQVLRPLCRKLMVIDDLANRQHDCDLLLDQNLGRDEADYSQFLPEDCTVLVGPRYALLREEFWQLRDKKNVPKNYFKNILVFFGGIDADNYTLRAIEILSANDFINIHVDVVIGAQNLYIGKIKLACNNLGFSCHVQTNQMAALMHKSDLYIGAGGGAILERIMMKLPSVTLAVADNQIEFLKFLGQTGSCIYLGCGKSLSDALFKQAILQAIEVIDSLTKNTELLCEEFFSDRVQWLEKLLIEQYK
jgi:UDP-2,4-diacetamido-2,4,6-trideoxy-beta-L-altropyranose hydrolase